VKFSRHPTGPAALRAGRGAYIVVGPVRSRGPTTRPGVVCDHGAGRSGEVSWLNLPACRQPGGASPAYRGLNPAG
jgi:hypothetical protein